MIQNRSVALALVLLACGGSVFGQPLRQIADERGLMIGAMIVDPTWNTERQKEVVSTEFNCATIGTFWKRTHPERDRYDWQLTDDIAEWADAAGMRVHLHPMLFASDSQIPDWVQQSDFADAPQILEDHIKTAARRYRGLADVWDVVNEAVAPSHLGGYRDNWWLRAMGPDYIVEAFRHARRYAPDAILVYNETQIELNDAVQSAKWRTTQEILNRLARENLVDALGWQLHTEPEEVLGPQFAVANRMRWVRVGLGLSNFVTELDMVIDPGDATLQRQGEAYRRMAEIWLPNRGCGWLQTWGVYDRHTWLGSEWRPLLLDEDYDPKPAYSGLRDALLGVAAVEPSAPPTANRKRHLATNYRRWRARLLSQGNLHRVDFNADGIVDIDDYLIWLDRRRNS